MKYRYYCKDGTTSEKLDGSKTLHREGGPAEIEYYEDGSIRYEYYYIEGKRHREDGPALIVYYEDGSIRYEYYYIERKRLSKEDFLSLMKEINSLSQALKLIDSRSWVRKLGKKEVVA